jgi:hypothetical protein
MTIGVKVCGVDSRGGDEYKCVLPDNEEGL